jgi:ssDNA-binding Zn-finger/Zn-ribbon topoisomerase 1
MKNCKKCGQLTDRYYSKKHKKCVDCFNRVTKRKVKDEFKPIVRRGRYETLKFIFSNPSDEIAINELLGCHHKKIRQHIEKQFKRGMTWANHGAWHIDHIRPFSSAKNMRELKMLFRWQNIQPLWAEVNLRKGRDTIGQSKIDEINEKMAVRCEEYRLSNGIVKTKTFEQLEDLFRDFNLTTVSEVESCARSIGYEREGNLFIKKRKL